MTHRDIPDGAPSAGNEGRSSLLRAGLAPQRRSRAWALRYLSVSAICTALVLIGWAVATKYFDPIGAGRLLYRAHDSLWLPLYSGIWTASFPESLVWGVPALVLLILVIAEFLGVWSLLRRLQVAVLRGLIAFAAFVLVAWQGILGRFGARAGLVDLLVREIRDDLLRQLTAASSTDPTGANYARLVDIQSLQMRLGLQDARDFVAVVETLGMAQLDPAHRGDRAATLREVAARQEPSVLPDWRHALDPVPFAMSPEETLVATARMEDPETPPELLACQTIGVALSILEDHGAERLAWFDTWARLRASADQPVRDRLARAETLAVFEFWAALAERQAAPANAGPDAFVQAFPGYAPLRARGELASAEIAGTGGTQAWRIR